MGTRQLRGYLASSASSVSNQRMALRSPKPAGMGFGTMLWTLLVLFGIRRTGKQPVHGVNYGFRSAVQYFQWAQRLPLEPAVFGLPSFGLVCALALSWLVMFHIFFYELGRPQSKGIIVSLMRQVPLGEVSEHWTEPIVLRIESPGPDLATRLYLNSKPLS